MVSFKDPVIDGKNMEDTDLYEWSRRPGFSIFCTAPLEPNEVINQFDSSRDLDGVVTAFFDSNFRLARFTHTTIDTLIPKTVPDQGYITTVGNMTYFSDGAAADMQKWDSATPFPTAINPSSWGIPAPTLTPSIYNRGCWLPLSNFQVNNAILDPNGNVEVVTSVFGPAGVSGNNQPLWPTTAASTINDGSIQWTNMGPLDVWLPDQNYPVPVVVLDTNGNLQLATSTTNAVVDWNAGSTYNVGDTVFFAGNFWTSLIGGNTNIPPSAAYATPSWVLAQNPITTGPTAPAWSTTVGGTTPDGSYTWMNIGPGALVESFGTSYVYCFRTIYGHLSTASPASINTGSIFGPQVATITSFQITGNKVTFQGTNNFVPGNVFTVTGLIAGAYLNNQPFIIGPLGLSPTQFSASFVYPNVPSTPDSGSTLNLIAAVTGQGTTSPLCNAVASISATEVVADIVKVYAVNNFVPGLHVTFSGVTVATFLNNVQLQIIDVDPNGQWFSVYFITANQQKSTDTGTATFNAVEIYRTSDGGGIYLFAGAVTNPPITIGPPIQPYDSGYLIAGSGVDVGTPGFHTWTNPNNVTSTSVYASISVPTPGGGGGGSRFSVLQTCKNIFSGPVSSGIQDTFGLDVTATNSILVFVNTFQISSWTVTDTQGNVYNLIAQHTDGNQSFVSVYLATNVAAGPTTVKLNVTGVGSLAWFGFGAMECNGLSGVVETPAYNFQTRGTTFDTGDITTSDANAVVFTALWSDLFSGAASTPPAAYTLATNQVVTDSAESQQPVQQQAVAYQLQTATGAFSPIWDTPSGLKALGVTLALDLALFTPGDALDVQSFGFAIPPSLQITGIEIDMEAYFTGTSMFGSFEVQLLKNGSPVGVPQQIFPTGSNVNYVLGGANNLWGTSWIYSDFNSEDWGVQITPVQLTGGTNANFFVRNVRARLTGNLNTTIWVFNDFTTDENLDELLIAPQNHLNDPPPGAPGSSVNATVGTLTAYWQGRPWMISGNYVYFGAGPDCTNGVPEESWPPANRFRFAGPPLGLEPTADGVGLLVLLADRVAAILGGPETISFYATDALSNFGISSTNAIFRDGSIIGLFTTQKQYFELIDKQKQEIGEHISDYLSANFDPTKVYVTMHRNGTDVGVFIGNGVDRIVRYGTNISAWSVPSFPVGGAGAMRSIETSVGVTSLMLAQKITGNGGSAPPPSTLPVGVQNTRVTLTAAQIKNAHTTPVQLIPAPTCPNRVIVPISAVLQLNFNTTAYSQDTNTTIGFGTSVADINNNGWMMYPANIGNLPIMQSTESTIELMSTTSSGQAAGAFDSSTHIINQPLYWANINDLSADVGDSTVTLNIQWVEVDTTNGKIVNGTGNAVYGSMTQISSLQLQSASLIPLVSAPGVNKIIVPVSVVVWGHYNTTPMHNQNLQAIIGLGTTWTEVHSNGAFAISPFTNHEDGFVVLPLGGVGNSFVSLCPGPGAPLAQNTMINQPLSFANVQTPQYTLQPNAGDETFTVYVQYMIVDTDAGTLASGGQGDFIPSFTSLSSAQINASNVTGVQLAPAPGANRLNIPVAYVATSQSNGTPYAYAGLLVSNTAFDTQPLIGINQTGGAGVNYFIIAGDHTAHFTSSCTVEENSAGNNAVYSIVSSSFVGGNTHVVVSQVIPQPYANTGGTPLPIIGPANGAAVLLGNDYTLLTAVTSLFTRSFSQILLGTPQQGQIIDDSSGMYPQELINQPTLWADANNNAANTANSTGAAMTQYLIVSMTDGSVQSQSSAYSGCGSPPPPTVNNYLLARDLTTWQDRGHSNMSDGDNYPDCYITIGSITLSQLGGPLFSLQHVAGYFDAVGTLNNGGPSYPDVWLLPNEVNDTKGVGFVYLPEVVQEPPIGQNNPSASLLALRWNVSMMNSSQASQYLHHLQVRLKFQPENAPNTIKAISFGTNQDT